MQDSQLVNLKMTELLQAQNLCLTFFGLRMQQSTHALIALNRLLNSYDFKTIIELGTFMGGLSFLLTLHCNSMKRKFYTWDIKEHNPTIKKLVNLLLGNICIGDIISDEATIKAVKGQIQSEGRTLLLCDGGAKIKEFSIYAPALKLGDFIMVHDYVEDGQAFECLRFENIWYGYECQLADLKPIADQNGIRQVYKETFDNAVWFCGVKE